jgi:hypothetical protein
LDESLLGLSLVPMADSEDGSIPASLEFDTILVRCCGHGTSCFFAFAE